MSRYNLTTLYGMMQGIYWMIFAAIIGYGTVYFLSLGLKPALIGTLFALAYVVAAVLQPLVAAYSDRTTRYSLKQIYGAILLCMLLLVVVLRFGTMDLGVHIFLYLSLIVLIWVLQPLTNAFGVYYMNLGFKLNFGVARGIGSASFAVISIWIGHLLLEQPTAVLLTIALVLIFLLFINCNLFYMVRGADRPMQGMDIGNMDFRRFFREYRPFLGMLFGIILLFTFHTYQSSYLIQIVRAVGGDASSMGNVTAIQAIVEIPAMFFSLYLVQKYGARRLIILAVYFWMLKAIGIYWAPSVVSLYAVSVLQALSYAPLIPITVYYANEVMREQDKFLGQSLLTMSLTLGGVVGTLSGGFILDIYDIKTLNLTAVAVTVLGGLIIHFALRKGTQKA